MTKIDAYMIQGIDGVKSSKVYFDKVSATIALRENFSPKQIENNECFIKRVDLVAYIDLKIDMKAKEICTKCKGSGKEIIVEEKEIVKGKGKKKTTEVVEEKKEIVCTECNGDKEVWVDKKAIVIY